MNEKTTKPEVESIQYMQTVGGNKEEKNMAEISTALEPDAGFCTLIDPPQNNRACFSFDSETDEILSTDGDSLGEDYQLSSTSSSSDDETKFKHDTKISSNSISHLGGKQQIRTSNKMSPNLKPGEGKISETSENVTKQSSFMEVLNDILQEQPEIPERSNLGPKPWLMKNRNPRLKKNYEVSNEPFIFKPKPVTAKTVSPQPTVKSAVENKNLVQDSDPSPIYDIPPSRGRMSSASSGNALSDNEKSVKYPSEADTGFCSNASSNPSPNNSSNNLSLLPTGGDSREPSSESQSSNAQELARAALQALSLSKNILQDMGKGKVSESKDTSAQDNSIYDEVPFSPLTSPTKPIKPMLGQNPDKKNLYDDVPPPDDVIKSKIDPKRTVISVPVFKPPIAPVRNNSNAMMSSESIYDITRSNTKTPTVTSEALELMYQLFGKDLNENNREMYGRTGYNQPQQQIYSRPSSVKSVTFGDGEKLQNDEFPSRPSSRAGSVYSEWSDCTINIPEYPESEVSTLPRTQIDFPRFPQVGFPPPPQNQAPHIPPNMQSPHFPTPNQTNFNPNFPYTPSHPNFPFAGDNTRPQSVYQRNANPYQASNTILSTNGLPPQPLYPLHNTNYMPHEIPNSRNPAYPPSNPYPIRPVESQMSQYNRPPRHAFSPPRLWGGFSPPHEFLHTHRHPYSAERRGRRHFRQFGGRGRGRSHSRSKSRPRRHNFYSDDDSSSRSPSLSPARRRDVMNVDVIANKSYIDGYKAALKDAVMTFAQKQGLKEIAAEESAESREERMHRNLRRALSAGRIQELPDNIELGDIRKAFALQRKSLSDDEYEANESELNLLVPSTGRPLSKNGSTRGSRGNRRQLRRCPDDDDVSPQRHRRRSISGSDHEESCDCSECEEEFEMSRGQRYLDGELMPQRPQNPRRNNPMTSRHDMVESGNVSPKMRGLRQRYMEHFEESSSSARAPVRANHYDHMNLQRDEEFNDERFRRAEERRKYDYEDVRFNNPNGPQRFRNDSQSYFAQPQSYPQNRGGFQSGYNGRDRRQRVQFGY